MTDPIKTVLTSAGATTTQATEMLLANKSGVVVGVQAIPIRQTAEQLTRLAAVASRNVAAASGLCVLAGLLCVLSQFDEAKVNKSIDDWQSASQHLTALESRLKDLVDSELPAQNWTAADRHEFDKFVTSFKSEITMIAAVCGNNATNLDKIREAFHDAAKDLYAIVLPTLLLVIASVALQFVPATTAAALGIGAAAGVTIAYTVWQICEFLADVLGTFSSLLTASSTGHFITESRASDVPPGQGDRDLKEITINWVHDASYYKQATQ